MTKQIVLVIAAFYGLASVVLGALGSHALSNVLSPEKISSFEVGVRYQMYHALALLVLGLLLPLSTSLEKTAVWGMAIGTLLFSGSIYLLSLAEYWKVNLKFLGPVTPLGGLFLIAGWGALLLFFARGNRI
ncbi:MAG: hypothetical protein BGN96_10185 [Bacteroidales bacterium 45-6]|nr:MAG: hypothetical protein BGN96_10185 [Bacteroidales bacterium 45-6]